jgi:hypothetical protein
MLTDHLSVVSIGAVCVQCSKTRLRRRLLRFSNNYAISSDVFIVSSPTLMLDMVFWLEALREFNSLISFQVDFGFFLLASRLFVKY